MNWLHYLLEANVYLAVFYLLYFVLFDKETHYKLNRIYLLSTSVISYLIPVVQIGVLKPSGGYDQVVTTIRYAAFKPSAAESAWHFSLQNGLIWAYIIGAGAMLVVFILKIFQLLRLTRSQKDLLTNKYKLIRIENSNTAFSFFNYVFIGTKVSGADTIIRHELVHINQKHSLDIVFLELIKIVSWFNPFIYLLQRSLKTLHEYIADEQTAAFENDALAYSSFLVSNAYGISGSSITHSFFNYNLLKKRIIMLNQKRSGNLARLKYLAALPVCAGLLCASTLGFSKTYGLIDLVPQKATDTIKKLKIIEGKPSKTATKIKKEVNDAIKDAVAEQKKLTVKEVPASGKVEEITIDPVKDTTKAADLIKKMPGVKIADNGDVIAQGKKVTKIRINGKEVKSGDVISEKAPTILKLQQMPPPMEPIPPVSKDFENLFKAVARTVHYPRLAREDNIVGSVVVKFDLDADLKISDIMVVKGIGSGCDEEVIRAIKAFTGSIAAKAGNYKMAVTFTLDGIAAPKSASGDLLKDSSFAGEVIVSGYPQKKQ